MKDLWARMEEWLSRYAPAALDQLNPPASPEQIGQAEATLGITFPEEIRASLLIHNGQQPGAPWLIDGWELLSLERIVDEWSVWKELLDGGDLEGCESESSGQTVKAWWSPAWIPLTDSGAGDHHCLDLQPGSLGVTGQIIQMWHDDSSREVMAVSYRDWLSQLVEDWEAGRYEFSEEDGGIVERE